MSSWFSIPSAQTVAPTRRAKRTSDSTSAMRTGSEWIARVSSQVELDDVRTHPHDLLQAGVSGAGVVDGDPRPALAQVGEGVGEQAVADVDLVLGQLDDHVREVVRKDTADGVGGERRGTDVDREVGSVRAPSRARAARIAAASSCGPQAAGVRLREPGRRGPLRGIGEASERLVADQAAGGEGGDRLKERLDGLLLEDALDLGALRCVSGEADVIWIEAARPRLSGALRPVERALRQLEERSGVVGVHGIDSEAGRAAEHSIRWARAGRSHSAPARRSRGRRPHRCPAGSGRIPRRPCGPRCLHRAPSCEAGHPRPGAPRRRRDAHGAH